MIEIKKCIKRIKEFHLSNINSALVSMKKNVVIKQQLDNVFYNNEKSNIDSFINIINSKDNFMEENYSFLINNFTKIIQNYNESVHNLKKEVQKIEKVISQNYHQEILALFNNSKNEVKDKLLMELLQIDNFVSQINQL